MNTSKNPGAQTGAQTSRMWSVLLCAGILLGGLLSGCHAPDAAPPSSEALIPAVEPTSDSTGDGTTSKVDTTEDIGSLDPSQINPLTGLPFSKERPVNRPLVVMLDNHFGARPQAALAQADVVYEILAEGLITRYMAVFYGMYPEHVGPVRSSRPYFIEKALEYDPYYVHVGGSMQALSDIIRYEMADLDGMQLGSFWREKHKKIPHNMYTGVKELLVDANRRGYRTDVPPHFFEFYSEFTVPSGESVSDLTIRYKQASKTDPVGYFSGYRYDSEAHLYRRYTNGEAHVDEDTGDQLTCSNIIVQYVSYRVLDSEGRKAFDLLGSGEGVLYTAGKAVPLTWKKSGSKDQTFFYDMAGERMRLNRGVTWFQLTQKGTVEAAHSTSAQ